MSEEIPANDDLEKQSKKELAALVRMLKSKLKELKHLESEQIATVDDLKNPAMGVIKDDRDYYHMVKIAYDLDSKAARIVSVDKFDDRDQAIVSYKAQQYLMEKIIRKARGGKFDN